MIATTGAALGKGTIDKDPNELVVRLVDRARAPEDLLIRLFRVEDHGARLISLGERVVHGPEDHASFDPPPHGGQHLVAVTSDRDGSPIAVRRFEAPGAAEVQLRIPGRTVVTVLVERGRNVGGSAEAQFYLAVPGDEPPMTRFFVRQRKVQLDETGAALVGALPEGRFTLLALRGTRYLTREVSLSGSQQTVLLPAPPQRSMRVRLVGKYRRKLRVYASSRPPERALDNSLRRPSRYREGEIRGGSARPGGVVEFVDLEDDVYAVSVMDTMPGYERTLWRREGIVPAGNEVVADLNDPEGAVTADVVVQLVPPPDVETVEGVVHFEVVTDGHGMEGKRRAAATIRLPPLHGVATPTFVPDPSSAARVAVSSAVFRMDRLRPPATLRLERADDRALGSWNDAAEWLLVEQPEGLPAVLLRLSDPMVSALVVRGDSPRILGMPRGHRAYLLGERMAAPIPVGTVSSGSQVSFLNAAPITRFLVIESSESRWSSSHVHVVGPRCPSR